MWAPVRFAQFGMGSGQLEPPPAAPSTPAVGWYANDNGLTFLWSAPRNLFDGENRLLFVDFSALSPIVAGETIQSASISGAGGLLVTSPEIDGARVYWGTSNPVRADSFDVTVTVTLSNSQIVSRTVTIYVPAGFATEITPDTSPDVLPGSVGWTTNDQALRVVDFSRFANQADRRLWFVDFGPMAELVAGDTIVGTPTIGAIPDTITVENVQSIGTKAFAILSGWSQPLHVVTWTVETSGGAVLSRQTRIFCEVAAVAFTYPTPTGSGTADGAIGWYANDDGLVFTQGAPRRKQSTEKRRYFMDYGAMAETLAGDTIASGRVGFSPSGPTLEDVAVVGDRLVATIAGGTSGTQYSVVWEVTYASGAIIARTVQIPVEDD
jgi:hypothetical protein